MEKLITVVFAIVGIIVVVAGIGLLLAFPVKWCWNYTMPHVFDLPTITWGQAWCINFLANMLIRTSVSRK